MSSKTGKRSLRFTLFEKFFDTPFEFHLLTMRRWKFYLNFIGNEYVRI